MAQNLKEIGLELLFWYKKSKRDLPWRQTHDPYKIWVSEIMLQQTQVITVIDYYNRFIQSFPDILSLAKADEEEVLALWKGLGYYSRARNLHNAAKILKEQYDGSFPDTFEEVRKLSGIGAYTAGAIMSIAYNKPYPAVDGNVLRVIARIQGSKEDIMQEKMKKKVGDTVTQMYPQDEACDFCQALMELGAMICTPQSPLCMKCPVTKYCKACISGQQGEIPVKKKKSPSPEYHWWVAWIERNGKILLEHRLKDTLLANMWGVPMVKKDEGRSSEELLKEKYGMSIVREKLLGTAIHVFTHQIWKMDVNKYTIDENELNTKTLVWKDIRELETLAIPTVFQKVIKLKD